MAAPTRFQEIYNVFLSKITEDMYLQLTEQETKDLLEELLISAIPKFEFPRKCLDYEYRIVLENMPDGVKYYPAWRDIPADVPQEEDDIVFEGMTFISVLDIQEINILATYMIVEWLGQQLASCENVRMKYSGSDFKFTSQANHMQKLLQMKKDYDRQGFHLQRLYKRRRKDINGVYRSTLQQIMEPLEQYQALPAPAADQEPDYEDLVEWQDMSDESEIQP